MLADDHWKGKAGEEVRRCILMVRRAQQAVEDAKRELNLAHDEHAAADRDLQIAKRVYYAGQEDQDRRIHAVKVTSQKREWLKALAAHDVFGASEMRQAATDIGWQPSDGALRTLASDYRKAEYFIGVSHGVVKLNRDRISSVLGPIFDDVEQYEPDQSVETIDTALLVDDVVDDRIRLSDDDNDIDDIDLPF